MPEGGFAMAGSSIETARPGKGSKFTFDAWTIVLGLFALSNFVNGVWMLGSPPHWFENLPAGVPDFGPLNEHFVRDIGCIYTMMGIGLAVAAVAPRWRLAACVTATAFYVLHALVHVFDTARGLVGPDHWMIDLPGIYVPAVILVGVTWMVSRSEA
jgi:hypothetical protein